jgi:PTH1 family peptidyl-tRNA hydrolase
MKIIFAQGNPGAQYAGTRHNIGFFMLDEFAKKNNVNFVLKPKFYSEIAEINLENEKILLAKPTTFYNETGIAARSLIDFYKLSPAIDLLVVHDELALPFGVIRTRPSGSDAGNNGIKSLNSHIGSFFWRLRIGVYNPLRDTTNDANFVLGRFSQEETALFPTLFEHSTTFMHTFIKNQLQATKHTI